MYNHKEKESSTMYNRYNVHCTLYKEKESSTMYNRYNVHCTLYKERHSQLALHDMRVYTVHIFYKSQKPMHTTQCSFKFSKMATEGAGRTQISTRGFQLKKGKIWRTVSTGCRQKDKYKDEAKLKWNAARMSTKQLRILDSLDFKQFWSVASSNCTPDSSGEGSLALV